MLNRLIVRDRLAELHAIRGILERAVECSLPQSDRHRADRNPPAIERHQHLLEPLPHFAKLILDRHFEIVEMQKRGV